MTLDEVFAALKAGHKLLDASGARIYLHGGHLVITEGSSGKSNCVALVELVRERLIIPKSDPTPEQYAAVLEVVECVMASSHNPAPCLPHLVSKAIDRIELED